jgi:hypothetical protein
MSTSVFNQDLHVNATLSAKTFNPPTSCITNAAIQSNAGISASKVVHQFPLYVNQAPGTAVVADTSLIHVARASGTLLSFEAATPTIATGADRTVTIDLQKSTAGGAFATVLSGTIVLDDDSVARVAEAGTFSSTSYVVGDLFQVVVTVAGAAGNQAQGLIVTLWTTENPQ